MPKMLIADDNQQISSVLTQYAKKDGFEVTTAYDGEEAIRQFETDSFDMVLLDVMMPKKDGFEVCREIRKRSNVPIIMVTARGEDFERIMGLDIGADDYIVKPFSPGEVMARVRAILRRLERAGAEAGPATGGEPGPEAGESAQIFSFDNLEINLDDFQVRLAGEPVSLTKKEIELLWTLATGRNKVFTREVLLDRLWGYDYYGDSRTVDSHIKRLRAKLDVAPHDNWEIRTIWGVGYKLEVHKEHEK